MSEQDLLQFPCDFPIKIMGARVDDFAQTVLDVVLRHAEGNQSRAAEILGINRATLRKKLKDYGLV